MTVTIENTAVDTTLNIAELTTASLTGTGVFDVLLQTLRLHLDREFTSGRINCVLSSRYQFFRASNCLLFK